MFYMCQKHLEFQVAQHEGESSNGPVEVRGWELTLSASLSLGLLLRWVSYWRALTAQSTDDCHLPSTVECLSRILGKSSGWCCESQQGLNWSRRSGWITHSNHLVAYGCVSIECIVESIRCSGEEGDTGRRQRSDGSDGRTGGRQKIPWNYLASGSCEFSGKVVKWSVTSERESRFYHKYVSLVKWI